MNFYTKTRSERAFYACLAASLLAGSAPGQTRPAVAPAITGILSANVQVPIMIQGKVAGTVMLAKGTAVRVLQTTADKSLIASNTGQGWVKNTDFTLSTPVTPETPPPALPAAVQGALPAVAEPVVPTPALPEPRPAVLREIPPLNVASYSLEGTTDWMMECIKAAGHPVQSLQQPNDPKGFHRRPTAKMLGALDVFLVEGVTLTMSGPNSFIDPYLKSSNKLLIIAGYGTHAEVSQAILELRTTGLCTKTLQPLVPRTITKVVFDSGKAGECDILVVSMGQRNFLHKEDEFNKEMLPLINDWMKKLEVKRKAGSMAVVPWPK